MRGKLPDVVKLPPSVTVPFSSFEEALKQRENKDMAKRLEAAVKSIPQTNAEEKLRECRDIVMEVSDHYHRRLNFSIIIISRRVQLVTRPARKGYGTAGSLQSLPLHMHPVY